MRLPFCSKIRNLASKFVLLCYHWISCQNKNSPEIQQLSCQHHQSNLPATLHWIMQPWDMLDISNVASDSVSFYQVLSPGLPWFVLMFLVKSRWERSLDRTKVPRSLTYVMQLSWNVKCTKQNTFYSHTIWSSQKKGRAEHVTGDLLIEWLALIWVIRISKKRTGRIDIGLHVFIISIWKFEIRLEYGCGKNAFRFELCLYYARP